MKLKNLIPYILLLIPAFAIAQQPEYPDSGFTNKAEAKNLTINGLKEGKWVEHIAFFNEVISSDTTMDFTKDNNAPKYRLIVYKGDKPYGIARSYTKLWRICIVTTYSNGKKNGVEKHFWANGKIQGEIPYLKGQRNGIAKGYYENGKLKEVCPYRNDFEYGVVKYYYENGILKSETPFEGQENGVSKEYYKNGTLKSETPFSDGKIKGVEKEYYENGKIKAEYTWYIGSDGGNGIELRKEYDENGNEIKK